MESRNGWVRGCRVVIASGRGALPSSLGHGRAGPRPGPALSFCGSCRGEAGDWKGTTLHFRVILHFGIENGFC